MRLPQPPENPVHVFRQELNLTQNELASMAGVTRQVVTKTEAGLYNSIPASLMKAIQKVDPHSVEKYQRQYKDWQLASLPVATNSIDPNDDGQTISAGHPYFLFPDPERFDTFVHWRMEIDNSLSGFCKLLKIQEIIVGNYEAGKTQYMPAFLWERLRSCGLSKEFIGKVANLPANSTVLEIHHG